MLDRTTVKANVAPEQGTGWHRHEADFQIVIMREIPEPTPWPTAQAA